MRVLAIGGSGLVGRLILPLMKSQHQIRVFDLRAPEDPDLEYFEGNVCDAKIVTEAMQGMDAFIYMAMGQHGHLPNYGPTDDSVNAQFDVHVKGLYIALRAASMAEVRQGVYASSMSVYRAFEGGGRRQKTYFSDEDIPTDAKYLYGLTKRLGEDMCRNACRQWPMSVNVLRLCWPRPDEKWLESTKADEPTLMTSATDTAGAFLAALKLRAGYQAFMISGDYDNKIMNMTRAKELLGWEPLSRPRAVDAAQVVEAK